MQQQRLKSTAAGAIQNAYVMDGGSAYQVGDVLTVTGVTTQSSFSPASCYC